MPYAKQTTHLFLLILFLQASLCSRKISKNTPISITNKVSGKQLSSNHKPKKKSGCTPNKADYSVNKPANAKFNADTGYDSGYESNDDEKLTFEQQLSQTSDDKIIIDFKNLIEKMRQAADLKRNIISNVAGNKLTRVANNITNTTSLYSPEDYVVQGLNIYRAAEKICILYENYGSIFAKEAHAFMQQYSEYGEKKEEFWINKIKKINQAVVLQLQKMFFTTESLEVVNEKLRLAENYVGLDDTHYNVTTTFKITDQKFTLEDRHLFKLTEKQKNNYRKKELQDWYIYLDSFEKKFVDAYVDKFLDGNHYIPTQLRNIPGLRNAYQKNVWQHDKNGQKKRLAMYYHSGSLASPNKHKNEKAVEADFQITKDNWDQIQEKDKNVEVISLNYNLDVPGFKNLQEKKIVEDTKKVVDFDRLVNLSINAIGTSSNLYRKYVHIVMHVLNAYKERYPAIYNAFISELEDDKFFIKIRKFVTINSKKSKQQQIEEIKDPKDKYLFKVLVELEKYANGFDYWHKIEQSQALLTIGNPNATTCAMYVACMVLMASLNHDADVSSILFSCKSGKDRSGLMSLLVDCYIILMSCPTLKQDDVINALTHIGHYQLLASINGGMAGRFGLKFVSSNEIPNNYKRQLFPKSATLTKIDLIKK